MIYSRSVRSLRCEVSAAAAAATASTGAAAAAAAAAAVIFIVQRTTLDHSLICVRTYVCVVSLSLSHVWSQQLALKP